MKIYNENNLPSSIGQAIYLYGDNSISTIKYFGEIDNEHGFILTDTMFYYNINSNGKICINDISDIKLRKTRHSLKELVIVENNIYHIFNNYVDDIIDTLELDYSYDMSVDDKIHYLSTLILNDIKDDLYEDTILDNIQNDKLNNYLERLNEAISMNDTQYHIEMQLIVDNVMNLVNELELDSDEIDELEKAQEEMNIKENQMFDQIEDMYANNKDSIKNVTGIDLDDIKNKSPEELNSMLDDLCERFNISKDQLASLASKFGNRKMPF